MNRLFNILRAVFIAALLVFCICGMFEIEPKSWKEERRRKAQKAAGRTYIDWSAVPQSSNPWK